MKTPIEKRDWILENCVDKYGNIDLKSLDFGNFNGNVYIINMKVKNDLILSYSEIGGNLSLYGTKIKGNVNQENQEIDGNLEQSFQKVKGDLNHFEMSVQGKICDTHSYEEN